MRPVVLLTLSLLCTLHVASAQAPVKRPKITGISHVRIYASDVASSTQFYGGLLGLTEKDGPQSSARFYINKKQYVALEAAGSRAPGMDLIAFATSDAERLRKYMAAKQVQVPAQVDKNSDGSKSFEVTDPEGHHIVFEQISTTSLPVSIGKGISHHMIHAGLVVHDPAAMDHFFKDILGFRPYWHGGRSENVTDWISLQVPDGSDWVEYMLNAKPDASRTQLGVMNHIALGVTSIQGAAQWLQSKGWKPNDREHPQLGHDGKWQLNVYDPDATRVEAMEFQPVKQPCCSPYTAPHPKAE